MADEQSTRFNLQQIPGLITCLTAVSIVASMIFEFGFLKGSGLSFKQVSITLGDLSTGALIWLPGIALSLWTSSAMLLDTLLGKTAHLPSTKWQTRLTFGAMAVCLAVYAIGGSTFIVFAQMTAMFISIWVVNGTFNSSPFSDVMNKNSRIVSKVAFTFCWFLFIIGFASAGFNVANTSTIEVNNRLIKGEILRSYERGFIVTDGTARYIPRDKVNSIVFSRHREFLVGVPCRYFDLLCFTDPDLRSTPRQDSP